MRISRAGRTWTTAMLVILGGCSGGGDATGPGGESSGTSHLKATVDGVAWSSDAGSELSGVPSSSPGLYTIVGSQLGGYTLTLSLYNVGGPGTYPLGVGITTFGGSAIVSDLSGSWSTPLSGAAGSIRITTLTADRMVGTFSFTADAFTGGATGSKTVTSGDFDLAVKTAGTVGPLAENAGGKVTATLDGTPWNAATVAGSLTGSPGIFALAASNDAWDVSISLANVSGPGTFALDELHSVGVADASGGLSGIWTSKGAGGGGTVTITSVTDARIKGTFSATLAPAPGTTTTGTVTLANGTFDLGRPSTP